MNIEQYSERVRGFLQSAQTLALSRGHQQFTPEHILKVLVDDETMAERRAKMEASENPWRPRDRERTVTTALRAYAKLATSADKGAVRVVD